MIGVVLVSHSLALAEAARGLVTQMVGEDFPIAVAAGVGEGFAEIGTDAVHIYEVLQPFCEGDGAVVVMDLGSAVLSAQTALELLEAEGIENVTDKVRLLPAPFIEAAVAASVQANTGADIDTVISEAMSALQAKASQLDWPMDQSPLTSTGGSSDGLAGSEGPAVIVETVIANPHGLHARPAAVLVQAMSGLTGTFTATNETSGRGPGSLCSLTQVSLLQARKGDLLRFTLRGEDSDAAADRLRSLIADYFGEADEVAADRHGLATDDPVDSIVDDGIDVPVGASEGIALGPVMALRDAMPEPRDRPAGSVSDELSQLDKALASVAEDMRHPTGLDAKTAAIFAAQALMLQDPALLDPVRARIQQGGVSALSAWRQESLAVADAYTAMEDAYFKARAADLRDIAARVSRVLAGEADKIVLAPNPPAILLTDELLPSEAMACQPGAVLGVLAQHGSPTAHAAILMRTLGIPMVVGADAVDSATVEEAGFDGATGEVWVDPSEAERRELLRRQTLLSAHRQACDAARHEPAATTDGYAVEILANIGSVRDAEAATRNGAEGVGLLRTEFVYLPYQTMPSEDDQHAALSAVLAPLGGGPVVVRTPDIGADKPAPFMPMHSEQNPFLGVRGIRLSLRKKEFFASNLRAILRAGVGRELWIMIPMVSLPSEMLEAREMLEQAHADLTAKDVEHVWPVRLGMMVEVPAAAVMADRFAEHADFFSIGTNDLVQYVLAAERGNGDLTAWQDAAHPSVLRVVRDLCVKAERYDCHVAVCGDAASDPVTAALLLGAGVESLSVRPNQIPLIKADVRTWAREDLVSLLNQAVTLNDATEVRALVTSSLPLVMS